MSIETIETQGLGRRYGATAALEEVSVTITPGAITGLLGRNGAGKTTLMSLLTAQDRPSAGAVRINGHDPFERPTITEQMCFVRDNQRYPDEYQLKHALRAAAISMPAWDAAFAARLVERFRLPAKTQIKKYSRGQLSSLAIVLGLASRASLTFFDEPYLGLDATARTIFYDELLEDYQANPRTIVLSTHLIDEMERLLEEVIIIDQGRLVRQAEVDELKGSALQVSGTRGELDDFLGSRPVLSRRSIGGLATAMIEVDSTADRVAAETAGLECAPVSLQDLVAAYGFSESASDMDERVAA